VGKSKKTQGSPKDLGSWVGNTSSQASCMFVPYLLYIFIYKYLRDGRAFSEDICTPAILLLLLLNDVLLKGGHKVRLPVHVDLILLKRGRLNYTRTGMSTKLSAQHHRKKANK
jgi:hypothetical protein